MKSNQPILDLLTGSALLDLFSELVMSGIAMHCISGTDTSCSCIFANGRKTTSVA